METSQGLFYENFISVDPQFSGRATAGSVPRNANPNKYVKEIGFAITQNWLMEPLERSLGDAIQRQRKELGYSQESLYERSGVHPVQISRIENGQQSPTLRVIQALAKGLNIEVSGLMKLAEQIRDARAD